MTRVGPVADAVFADLVDASPDGMLLAGRDGRMLVVNRQMEALFGYEREEMLGQPVEMLMPEGFRAAHAGHRHYYAATPASRPMGSGLVLTGLRRNGTRFPLEISLSPLPSSADHHTIATVRDVTDRVATNDRLRQVERDVAVGEDRQRIARDLHDRTIQRLFAMGLAAQSLNGRVADPELRDRLQQMVVDLDATILDLRSSIFELAFFDPSRSLRAQVLDVCAGERPALGVAPTIRFVGPVETVEASLGDELMAVLREALSNVGRHARATAVSVTVIVDEALALRVDDDGVGLPPEAGLRPGNGLYNMKVRAENAGGTFGVAPREPTGTRLDWSVPLT